MVLPEINKSSYYSLFIIYIFLIVLGNHSLLSQTNNFESPSNNIINYIIIGGDTIYHKDNTDNLIVKENEIIEFVFCEAPNQKYKYYLSGHGQKMNSWTYKNSTFYYKLKKGKYKFIVLTPTDLEDIKFTVVSNFDNFIISGILLLILIFTTLIILYFLVFQKKQDKNYLKPILKKYIKTGTPENTTKTLSHKASKKYEKATILFADIQGFTKIVEHMNPETLIDELDKFFIHFDEVAEKYKIEKIKTIGDAYMCAGGLPEKNSTNPIEVILAAIEMQQYMKHSNDTEKKSDKDFWELRIGIHTGPVISGIIGRKKLSFDIWGDSVNIASRMESSGVAGKINISGVTYNLIKDFFICEYRGKMPIKYKGETDMYFVNHIVPKLSIDGEGTKPNKEFYTKLQWIRYEDLEEHILNQLKNELSSTLKYHNVKHTIDVCTLVEIIGRAEGLNQKDLLLVKTAALFHDTGFMISPTDHENHSVRFAQQILPKYQYTSTEIEEICNLILITKKDSHPIKLIEKVLKDADLDYLGRADFIPLTEKLWEEEHSLNKTKNRKEWFQRQKNLLKEHNYNTITAQQLRQVSKKNQEQKIIEILNK